MLVRPSVKLHESRTYFYYIYEIVEHIPALICDMSPVKHYKYSLGNSCRVALLLQKHTRTRPVPESNFIAHKDTRYRSLFLQFV
jgi:hypothetical protein